MTDDLSTAAASGAASALQTDDIATTGPSGHPQDLDIRPADDATTSTHDAVGADARPGSASKVRQDDCASVCAELIARQICHFLAVMQRISACETDPSDSVVLEMPLCVAGH